MNSIHFHSIKEKRDLGIVNISVGLLSKTISNMKNMHSKILWIIFFFLINFSKQSLGQETSGNITGKVLDGVGLPLPGATILAVHLPSGTRYSTASATTGRYTLSGLRIGGPYQITVSYIGYESQTRSDIEVNLGGAISLNFALADQAKKLSEVLVRASKASPRVNTFGAGSNISQRSIQNMPTANRSIQDITRLVPQGSKDNSFGGTNFRYNNVTIDGAINNDAIGFSPSLGGISGSSGMPGSSTRSNPISLDAIQDIQVYLAPFDVKIGNFTGGSINAVTRSGTNTIQGSIYGFGRNSSLIGPNKAGDGKPIPSSFYDYQTGFRLGLPLIKNKLFFFTNIEVARRQDPLTLYASSPEEQQILTATDAAQIAAVTASTYHFDVGSSDYYKIFNHSVKIFSRFDYNFNEHHQFSIRNNTILSSATNLERDQQNFRFGSIDFLQQNNQTSTVFEWKGRFHQSLSNSFIAGYTTIHDYRTPNSDPTFPQIQITGRTPGTTIFFGTDREASIFNLRQKTFEITDNLTWYKGDHTILFGTHNELYTINYGFVNAWNGRIEYPSIQEYLSGRPIRARGSYYYGQNDRENLLRSPSAKFNINFFSAYIQDEIRVTDNFKFTPGIRFDFADVPHKQIQSQKGLNPNYNLDNYAGTSFRTTPLSKITNNYLGRIQFSPRIGFRYEPSWQKNLVLRGGLGLFSGRIPFAWLGYAFYNNGDTYGAFDQRADVSGRLGDGSDPLLYSRQNGIEGYASKSVDTHNPNEGKTQIDVIDNKFKMPKVLRGSVAIDFTDNHQFKYTLEAIYTKTIRDVKFQQINTRDVPAYYDYDSVTRYQPFYTGRSGIGQGTINNLLSNAYELSNTTKGFRYSLSFTIARSVSFGSELLGDYASGSKHNQIDFSTSYTYAMSKDISNGIRNSLESNFQLNQALSPNDPRLHNSNFDIRNRIIASVNYRHTWKESMASFFSLFFNAQSGTPFTYGFIGSNNQGLGQQVALAYIPLKGETNRFFAPLPNDQGGSAEQQAAAFDSYIDHNPYLSSRRGNFTERNEGRTPWNVDLDIKLAHDFYFKGLDKGSAGKVSGTRNRQILTFSIDIINFTNLLYKKWGIQTFSPNTFNSTASIGLSDYIPPRSSGGYPQYTFINPGKPYSIDFFNSRYQIQLGVRYSF